MSIEEYNFLNTVPEALEITKSMEDLHTNDAGEYEIYFDSPVLPDHQCSWCHELLEGRWVKVVGIHEFEKEFATINLDLHLECLVATECATENDWEEWPSAPKEPKARPGIRIAKPGWTADRVRLMREMRSGLIHD